MRALRLRNVLLVAAALALLPELVAAQAPVVTIDRVRAQGPLGRGPARRTLAGALPTLRTCYATALATNAALAGTLELRVMVSSDGGVVAASVAARSFDDGELERCVSEAVMALRFTAREAGFTTLRPTLRFGRGRVRRAELEATGEGVMGGHELFSMGTGPTAYGEGTLEDRAPQVQPGLEPEHVFRVLRRQRRRFLYCYERVLVDDPAFAGRVELRFVIGADGTVQTAMVHGSTLGPRVDGCLIQQLRRMRFPETEGAVTVPVRYPLRFSPAS